ncbi:DUF2726 domain-containing protein [Vibrio sp. 10N.222.54.C3]|uniref:DUF2726 domain-containing protein n=1 Tax=unclassified Vibrio TaxID=2614977 RepID=UPI003550F73C
MDTTQDNLRKALDNSPLYKRSILNKSERNVYFALKKLTNSFKGEFYIYPQINLGEIISAPDSPTGTAAYSAINSKRVDFCIADRHFNPIAVIEFQGEGHFQGDAKLRDDIKYKAATKAGIYYEPIYDSELSRLDVVLETRLKPILDIANIKNRP